MYVQVEAVEISELYYRPFVLNSYKAFLEKNKNNSGTNKISFSGCF